MEYQKGFECVESSYKESPSSKGGRILSKVNNEFAKNISEKSSRTQRVEKKITKILQNSDS